MNSLLKILQYFSGLIEKILLLLSEFFYSQYLWLDKWRAERMLGEIRSSRWPAVRKKWLKENPECAVCGRKDNTVPHHIFPFHLDIERKQELDYNNLITLCERPSVLNCHLIFGHYGNFVKKYNPNIREEAKKWKEKLYPENDKIKEKNM